MPSEIIVFLQNVYIIFFTLINKKTQFPESITFNSFLTTFRKIYSFFKSSKNNNGGDSTEQIKFQTRFGPKREAPQCKKTKNNEKQINWMLIAQFLDAPLPLDVVGLSQMECRLKIGEGRKLRFGRGIAIPPGYM